MLSRLFFWKCVYVCRPILLCAPPMVWRLRGMNNWLEKRSSEQEGAVEKEDRVFLGVRPLLSPLLYTHYNLLNKQIKSHLQSFCYAAWTAPLFVHLHFVFLCIPRCPEDPHTALSQPFLGHLLLWSLVKMQPRFTAFFTALFFLLRFSLTTKLFDSARLS